LVRGVSEIKPLVSLQNLDFLEVSVSVRFWIKTAVSVSISKPSQHYNSSCMLAQFSLTPVWLKAPQRDELPTNTVVHANALLVP